MNAALSESLVILRRLDSMEGEGKALHESLATVKVQLTALRRCLVRSRAERSS